MKSGSYARLLAIFLAVVLISSSLTITSFAANEVTKFADIKNHWAEKEIKNWVENGWIAGYADGTFRPDKYVTRAEFLSFINRSFGFTKTADISFKDIKPNDWFYEEIRKAKAEDLIRGYEDGTLRPNNPITREEATAIVARLLKLQPIDKDYLSNYKDKNEISNWSKDAINSLVAKGLLEGYGDNTLGPKKFITRAETIVILNRALELNTSAVVYDKPGTYGPESGLLTVTKNVEIKAPDIILRNMVIKGDLLIAKEVGDGNLTLQNVAVEGKTLVNGGGEHSIYLENCALAQVVVNKEDGRVRIVVKGDTKVDTVNVQSGAKIEGQNASKGIGRVVIDGNIPADAEIVLAGNFGEVEVKVPKVSVKVEEGMVNRINIAQGADEAKIELGEKAEVKMVEVNSKATISGKGYIETAVVKADGVTIEQKPFNLEIAENVTANVGGEEVKGSKTKEPTTEETSGGSYTTPPTTPPSESSSTGLFDKGYPAVVEIEFNYVKVLFENSRIDGKIYYIKKLSTENLPSIDEIINGRHYTNFIKVGEGELVIFEDLQPDTEYNFYFVVVDNQGNIKSDLITLSAKTKPGLFVNGPRLDTVGSNYIDVYLGVPNFDGKVYFISKLPTDLGPRASEIIENGSYSLVKTGKAAIISFDNLKPNTEYGLYIVATDLNGNPLTGAIPFMAKTAPIGFDTNLSDTTVGLYSDFFFRAFNLGSESYNNVKATFKIYPNNNDRFSLNKGDILLQYDDNGKWVDIPVTVPDSVYSCAYGDFGTAISFEINTGYDVTTHYRIKLNKANGYEFSVDFTSYDDANPNGKLIGSYQKLIRAESVSFQELSHMDFIVDQLSVFTIAIKTNNVSEDVYAKLKATFTFTVADEVYGTVYALDNHDISYTVGNITDNSEWIKVTTDDTGSIYIFEKGIRLLDFNDGMFVNFMTTFQKPGIYKLKLSLVNATNDDEIGTSSDIIFTVKPKQQ